MRPPCVTRSGPRRSCGVGAAPEIGDVVGQVRPDLQEERHGERRERGNEIESALRPRHRAANENR